MSKTILDLCAYLGLAAVGTATVNMILGLLIALRYSPVRLWPHRRLNIFHLHNWTAYSVLLLIVLHPAVLLLGGSTHFALADVLLPIQSPVQPILNTVGAAALYVLLMVIVTSLFRLRMARPLWRKLHYLVFPAFILMFIHSVFTDPALSNGKVDLLDGGKCSSKSVVRFRWLRGLSEYAFAAAASGRAAGPSRLLEFLKIALANRT
jgi:predicted ferric reductase